jgi:hypothetical protein
MASIVHYDPAIRDALKRIDVTLDELKALRDQARKILEEQGDLAGALRDLEKEIERRSK